MGDEAFRVRSQTVLSHVQAGKLKALAITGAKRSDTLPQFPTGAEAGVSGYEAVGWFGLLAPAAAVSAFLIQWLFL
jgi:tripartite-type tricarboxylate transporter receptor subunit TctC